MEIAIVVPTMESRKEVYHGFIEGWKHLFAKHQAQLITVYDGDHPTQVSSYWVTGTDGLPAWIVQQPQLLPKEIESLIYNKNDGVRNCGFYEVSKSSAEIIITLDDDTLPLGDPIQDHIDALNMKVPVSWVSTASEYMRGFPYCVREEAEVVLSHGVWKGVADWDAPTQLVNGNKEVSFYKGAIPKGVYYPMCGMNIAFKRKMLPYMYYAPMGYKVGMDRFADIWLGIESKRIIDREGWAVVSGYSTVRHERASNVWKNLQKEAKGLELNETYWKGDETDPYFKLYKEKRNKWEKLIKKYDQDNTDRD